MPRHEQKTQAWHAANGLMTIEEFNALRPGDLLVWRGSYLRTVIVGPKPYATSRGGGSLGSVTLAIRHRSWTNRVQTTYGYHDLKWIAFPLGRKTRGPALKHEIGKLKELGFDVRSELRRELSEKKSRATRMGRPLCDGFGRLERLAKGR